MRFANFIRLEIDRNALYDMDLWRPFFIPALFPPCGRGGSGGAVPGKRSEEGMRSRRAGASDAAGGRTAAQGAGRDEEAGAAEPDAGRPCPESVIGVVLSVMELLCRGIRCVSLHRGTFRASGFPRPSQHAPPDGGAQPAARRQTERSVSPSRVRRRTQDRTSPRREMKENRMRPFRSGGSDPDLPEDRQGGKRPGNFNLKSL